MKLTFLAPVTLVATVASVSASSINVTFTNNGNSGFFLTPLFAAVHDGNYDTFNPGTMASGSLESLAEDGDFSGLAGDLTTLQSTAISTGITGPSGFGSMMGQPPLLDGGETGSVTIPNLDPVANRYFSFASMLVPTNDSFIANGNPQAYELFDASGTFLGPITIEILASQIWDAGTEVNDGQGAPFQTGGGTSSDENGTIALANGLSEFINLVRPAGLGPVGNDFADPNTVVATITIVPEPSTALLAGLGVLGLMRRRRA